MSFRTLKKIFLLLSSSKQSYCLYNLASSDFNWFNLEATFIYSIFLVNFECLEALIEDPFTCRRC